MNGEIRVRFADGSTKTYAVGTTLLAMARERQTHFRSRIVAARVNNALTDLQASQHTDAEVDFFDLTSGQGIKVYERSLTFVLIVGGAAPVSRQGYRGRTFSG